MKQRTPDSPQRKTLTQRLTELDRDLADILAQRASLYAKAVSAERRDRSSGAEAGLDRALWPIWQERMTAEGLDAKVWRQLFVLANSLGLDSGRAKAQDAEGFVLNPKRGPVDLDLPGPASNLQARLLAFLAGVTGQPLDLSGIILNDGLFELAKGLNGLDAGFAWTSETLAKGRTKPASLEGQSIFCGHDPLNFFLLLGHGLAFPGRVRFAGGSDLKLMDLRTAASVCLRLGARLASVDTKSSGLPARLETGGPSTSLLELSPADLAAGDRNGVRDLAFGLAASAWAFQDGLTLTWPKGDPLTLRLRAVRTVLALCGVEAILEDGRFSSRRADLRVPAAPKLDLDPLLCSVLLAMPAAHGGRTRLTGPWPAGDPCADAALALLRDAGLDVASGPREVSAQGRGPAGPDSAHTLDVRACPQYLPLAVALAALSAGRTEILLDPDAADPATGLLGRLGLPFTLEQDRLAVEPGGAPAAFGRPWLSPAPAYSLALSLIALRGTSKQGLALANPSDLSALWPGYWAVYNRLPAVHGALIEKQDDKENNTGGTGKKGKRIRVGGDS